MVCIISHPALLRREGWRPVVAPARRTWYGHGGSWAEVPGCAGGFRVCPLVSGGQGGAAVVLGTQRQPYAWNQSATWMVPAGSRWMCSRLGLSKHLCLKKNKIK